MSTTAHTLLNTASSGSIKQVLFSPAHFAAMVAAQFKETFDPRSEHKLAAELITLIEADSKTTPKLHFSIPNEPEYCHLDLSREINHLLKTADKQYFSAMSPETDPLFKDSFFKLSYSNYKTAEMHCCTLEAHIQQSKEHTTPIKFEKALQQMHYVREVIAKNLLAITQNLGLYYYQQQQNALLMTPSSGSSHSSPIQAPTQTPSPIQEPVRSESSTPPNANTATAVDTKSPSPVPEKGSPFTPTVFVAFNKSSLSSHVVSTNRVRRRY